MQPELFLNGDQPQAVAEPAADGATFDHGVLGEVQTGVLLEGVIVSGSLSRDQEQLAAHAWAGDRYVAWSSGDSYCVRARFATRSAAGATALTNALQTLAARSAHASVEPGPQPVLTSCG